MPKDHITKTQIDILFRKNPHKHESDGKGHCKICGKALHTNDKNKVKGTIPKTKRGKEMVAKLGRKKKTGGFAKIASKASKEYGSKEQGQKVAGAIYQKMVRAKGR